MNAMTYKKIGPNPQPKEIQLPIKNLSADGALEGTKVGVQIVVSDWVFFLKTLQMATGIHYDTSLKTM